MNIQQLLDGAGVRWRWGRDRSQIQACCVFCHETQYRMGINLEKKAVHCFKGDCQWHGSIFKLIKELRGEYVKLDGLGLPDDGQPVVVDLPEEFELLWGYSRHPELGFGKLVDYMLRRGVTREELEQYHVGGALSGRFADRIIFPVFYGTTLYTFLGRTIHPELEPRYLNAKHATRAVWGLAPATPEHDGWLILCEGLIKSFAMKRVVGGCHAASLGNQLSAFQIEQIEQAGFKHVFVVPDPGTAGLQGLVSTGDALTRQGVDVWFPWPLPKDQADDATPRARKEWVDAGQVFTRASRLRLLRELGR